MAKAYANSLKINQKFWARVERLVTQPTRGSKRYKRVADAGRPNRCDWCLKPLSMCCRNGRCRRPTRSGSASAIHRKCMLWSVAGFFERLWCAGLAEYGDLEGMVWAW